jgi:hypothetical protein
MAKISIENRFSRETNRPSKISDKQKSGQNESRTDPVGDHIGQNHESLLSSNNKARIKLINLHNSDKKYKNDHRSMATPGSISF